MKKICKLTFSEIKHLRWTVLVTMLALTFFTASFLSVVFVYRDLSYNVFNHFDATNNSLTFFAYDASVSQISGANFDGTYYGDVTELTDSGLVLTAQNGNSFKTEYEQKEDLGNGVFVTHVYSLSGCAVVVTERYLNVYGDVMQKIPMPKAAGQILLDEQIAQALQVQVGDKVLVGNCEFSVCGTYERDAYTYEEFDLRSYWLLAVDENTVFESVHVESSTSQQLYQAYLHTKRAGIDVSFAGWFTQTYMDNLALIEGFLIAVAAIVFAVNLAILYATFSVILHNRLEYVCRLKVMGATDGLIFAIYFAIIVILLVVICVAGYFLSQVIVSNIMKTCEQAFGSPFSTRVSFGFAGVYFAVITLLLASLCYVSVRRIDNAACVDATRSD